MWYKTTKDFLIEDNLVFNLKKEGKYEVNDVCVVIQAKHLSEEEIHSLAGTIQEALNNFHVDREE